MTEKKTISRSMRFSDELADLIEAQPGDTFTAKFEYLARKCIQELPQKQKELKEIQDAITRERENLRTVRRAKEIYCQNLNNLDWAMQNLTKQADRCIQALESIDL